MIAPAHTAASFDRAGKRRTHRAPPPVTLLDVVRPDGSRLLVAVSRSHAGTGYELTPESDGRFTYACAGYGWRGDCEHVRAASQHVARAGVGTRTTSRSRGIA